MKTVLVICESGYWRDLRDGLAEVGCDFLGFDKKKPNRQEIDQLVAKADFVVIRNLNVAHHSVRFAKEAAKASDTPFWVGSNFGAASIIERLKKEFPRENFAIKTSKTGSVKPKKATVQAKKMPSALTEASANEIKHNVNKRKKHLPLKSALKDFKIDDDDIDFEKLFKS